MIPLCMLYKKCRFAEILDGADVTRAIEDHVIVQEMTQIIEGLQGEAKTDMKGKPYVDGK